MKVADTEIQQRVEAVLDRYQRDQGLLVSILQDIQAEYNYLPREAVEGVVGVSAISLVNRGVDRQMATPFYAFSEACIACGSCAYVCPTGAISTEDVGDTRIITMPHTTMEFKLKKCNTCGRYWAPERQLDYIIREADLPADAFDNCPDCRD